MCLNFFSIVWPNSYLNNQQWEDCLAICSSFAGIIALLHSPIASLAVSCCCQNIWYPIIWCLVLYESHCTHSLVSSCFDRPSLTLFIEFSFPLFFSSKNLWYDFWHVVMCIQSLSQFEIALSDWLMETFNEYPMGWVMVSYFSKSVHYDIKCFSEICSGW